MEVTEFYVDESNTPCTNIIYKKSIDGTFAMKNPTKYLLDYLSIQGVELPADTFRLGNVNNGGANNQVDLNDLELPKAAA